MDYVSIRAASEKWGVSSRRVQTLCEQNRIPGVTRLGRSWAIPQGTVKPPDARYKENRKAQRLIPPAVNEKLFRRILEQLPIPIIVLNPDGTALFSNEAFIKIFRIADNTIIDGKYNPLHDPDIEKWGFKKSLQRALHGEIIEIFDKKVPAQDLVQRISTRELSFESIFQNITLSPIYEENQLASIAAVFVTSRYYRGKDEIIKSKEYIESHWLEDFDIDVVARAANISKYHFARLFKTHTGTTPYGYYQNIKINKLKEKLCDNNLTISQAFAACGLSYSGNFAKVFKERVGLTPSQYRASVMEKG